MFDHFTPTAMAPGSQPRKGVRGYVHAPILCRFDRARSRLGEGGHVDGLKGDDTPPPPSTDLGGALH